MKNIKYPKILYFVFTFWSLGILKGALAAGYGCDSLSYRIGVTVRCEHPVTGESINCRSEKVPLGAVARYKCGDYYVTLDGDETGGNMTCNQKGKWTPEHPFRAFTCNMDCGRQLGDNKWPWHAAIFKREHESAPYKYLCGGTLLNPFNKGLMVLTAAQCLNPDVKSNLQVDTKNIKIAFGLVTADFKNNQKAPEVDIHSVKRVVTNTQGQIAISLIKLEKEVMLKDNVLPVCFSGNADFAKELLKEGSYGEFVGFGQRISGEYGVLRGIRIPVLSPSACRNHFVGKDNEPDICAGYLEGDNICIGDNGGSIFFSTFSGHSRRNFVQGIYTNLISESRGKTCESYVEFTRLVDHFHWIREAALGFYVEDDKPIFEPQNIEIAFQRETSAPISRTSVSNTAPDASTPIYPQSPNSGHTQRSSLGPQRRPTFTPVNYPEIPESPSRIPEYSSRIPESPSQIPKSPSRIPNPQVTRPGSVTTFNPRDYELVGLDWHNRFRNRHDAPHLVLNHELSREAQYEAEESLRKSQYFSLSGVANWFSLTGAALSATDSVKEAVKDWYKSRASYNRNNPKHSPFTHIVWKSATDIGVGYASKGQDQVVVVKYKLLNNMDINTKKAFTENVLPALSE